MTIVEPAALLADLTAAGVRLSIEGDQLRCQASPGVLTDQLVDRIRRHRTELLAVLRQRPDTAPLAPTQERLWLENRLRPENTAYHLPLELRLVGPVHPARLRFALAEVVRRHSILRTTFPVVGDEPRQRELPHSRPLLALVDLSGLPPARRAEAREAVATAVATRPFAPDSAPAHRSVLVRVADTDHDLLHTRHHIVADGASLRVLASELTVHDAAAGDGAPAGLADPVWQFADVARWQRDLLDGGQAASRVEAGRHQLTNTSTAWNLLSPPADHPPSAVRQVVRHIDATDAVGRAARGLGATAFSVLATAFGLAITSATDQQAIVIGVPVTGRTRTETTTMIGSFATVAPVHLDYGGDTRFDDAVRSAHREIGRAFAEHDLPPERSSRGREPRYSVSLTQQDAPVAAPRLGDASVEVAPLRAVAPKFPLAVTIATTESGHRVLAEHDPDRIATVTVEAVLDRFTALLAAGITEPTTRCRELVRRIRIRPEWTVAEKKFPAHQSLGGRFTATALRFPDTVAVTDSHGSVTYRHLLDRARRLARALCTAGVGAETPVAVCVDHSAALAVALVGAALAGAVAVPLDPEDPPARHESILDTSGAAHLVVGERQERALRWFDGDTLVLDRTGTADRVGARPLPTVVPDQLAYVIHTSGSTGHPKGVMVTHANVTALFDAATVAHPFDFAGTWSVVHSSAFDFSVWELWGPLLHGGRAVIVPRATTRDPAALADVLRDQRVTVHSTTPTAYQALVDRTGGSPAVNLVVFGGDSLPPVRLRSWVDGGPVLVNMYGITETTVHVTCKHLTAADADTPDSPIGTPLPGVRVAVVDQVGGAVPPGGVGELLVAGWGVARGYLGAPALTADRFGPAPGGRAYRSGDRVRLCPDGELAHLGRVDRQVKLRGHRVEPAEVEAALLAHPDVAAAAVVAGTDQFGRDCLDAYVVPRAGTTPGTVVLRRHLAAILPPYLVPATFTHLVELPRTRNGKLDRAALPGPDVAGSTGTAEPPATPTEKVIAEIWSELLGVEPIGRFDDFFALGGDSLAVVRMHSRVTTALRTDLSLAETYRAADLASLAAAADRSATGEVRR